jgi:hypothetical protein
MSELYPITPISSHGVHMDVHCTPLDRPSTQESNAKGLFICSAIGDIAGNIVGVLFDRAVCVCPVAALETDD